MKTRILFILITLLCAGLVGVQSARAATITVTNTNDSGAGSLRQAIADANPGDTIDFAVATPATITLTSGELVVGKSLTINGPAGGHLSISGNAASRVFYVCCGSVTISNLTITNGNNGGILHEGYSGFDPLTINNCTISGNTAPQIGGGITNVDATLIINNSTISGNSATWNGGGIYTDGAISTESATATITNSTFSDNYAYYGGGIWNGYISAGLTIGNTIFRAGDIADGNGGYGPLTSLGYNISDGAGGGMLTGPGDQTFTDALLGPLQDNGGPTFTHALLAGSPAIDAGDPSFTPPPYYDQRGPGFARVVNGRMDIGAFEVQPESPTSCAAQVQAPINADGSSVFNARRGVVPVKFRLTCNGVSTCDLPPATIAVTRTAGGVIGTVNESVYSSQADSGPNFRTLDCQYHYNLNSGALGVGTYRVDILIDGQVVGSATFQLR